MKTHVAPHAGNDKDPEGQAAPDTASHESQGLSEFDAASVRDGQLERFYNFIRVSTTELLENITKVYHRPERPRLVREVGDALKKRRRLR